TMFVILFLSSRRRHTRFSRDWSSDVCSSDLPPKRLCFTMYLMQPGNDDQANQEIRQTDEQSTAKRAGLLGLPYLDSRGWSQQVELVRDILSVDEMYKMHVIPIELSGGSLSFAITITTPQTIMKQLRERFSDMNLSFV